MSLPPTDYDGAWKRAIQQYFAPFLELFFPQVHAGIDWQRPISFRETELQQIAPEDQTGKQRADLLVEVVQRDGAPALVLIHVEVQNQHDPSFAERMLRYHARIFDKYRRPVVSLAVLGDEALDWQPTHFGYARWGCRLLLEFPIVKLRAIPQAVLEGTVNPSKGFT